MHYRTRSSLVHTCSSHGSKPEQKKNMASFHEWPGRSRGLDAQTRMSCIINIYAVNSMRGQICTEPSNIGWYHLVLHVLPGRLVRDIS